MEYTQWKTARLVTCKLLDMMEEGLIDPHEVAKLALNWLSESSVAEMVTANLIQIDSDEDEDEDEDDVDEDNEVLGEWDDDQEEDEDDQEDVTGLDDVDDYHDEYESRD